MNNFNTKNKKIIIGDLEVTGNIKTQSIETQATDHKFYQKINYEELVRLRDSKQLTEGRFYRIIDYITTTSQEDTKSAEHPFDIIVVADSNSTLNENARAVKHDSDEYFASSNLSAWELKYCLDNDTDRFTWALILDCNNKKANSFKIKDFSEVEFKGSLFSDGTISSTDYKISIDNSTSDKFIAMDVIKSPIDGQEICVLYKTDEEGLPPNNDPDYSAPDTADPYLYNGSIMIDGIIYDRWRKYLVNEYMEGGGDWADNVYTWVGYSDTLTNSIVKLPPSGKGVIYYMKDEFGNEAPYDFKNIQFKKSASWFQEHLDWVRDNIWYVDYSTDVYFYTFSLEDFDQKASKYIVSDLSLKINPEWSSEGLQALAFNNIIKPTFLEDSPKDTIPLTLKSNIFFDSSEEGYHFQCHSNYIDSNCGDNFFGPEVQNNKIYSGSNNLILSWGTQNNEFYNCSNCQIGSFNYSNIFKLADSLKTGDSWKFNYFDSNNYENIKFETAPSKTNEFIYNIKVWSGLQGGTAVLPKVIQVPDNNNFLIEFKPSGVKTVINPAPDINYYWNEEQISPFEGFSGTTEELFNILGSSGTEHKWTDTSWMFIDCWSLTTIPQIDTASVVDMSYMFYNCQKLKSIPLLDTRNVISMCGMFSMEEVSSSALILVPQLNTHNVIDMSEMFYNCSSLTTIPQLDTSKVTNMNSMFDICTSLKTIPLLNTSSVTDMSYMFSSCRSLTTIPYLDTSSVTAMNNMFADCTSLKEIHMKNINATLSIDDTILEHDALVELIGNLMPQSNPQTPSKTLTLGATLKAKLSPEEIKVATDKGWTIA